VNSLLKDRIRKCGVALETEELAGLVAFLVKHVVDEAAVSAGLFYKRAESLGR
jgi:hypothetical protein